MAEDWRRNDRDRFRSDPYGRERGRGTDYEGDGTIARRGFGNDRSGFEGRGSHISDRDRGYMGSPERDYARHEDFAGERRGAVRYDRPYWGESRGSGFERSSVPGRRSPEDYEAPGYGDWGSPSRSSRGSDYGRSHESDYGHTRSGRDPDTEAAYRELNDRGDGYVGRTRNHGFSGGEGRGFWREAVDEVKSWFGDDDDRDTRYGRGRHESNWDRPSHRGRGPKGHTRSDERIREDVSDRLTDDPHIDASEIEVQVSNREVTLTGTVNSRFEKRHAEDLAESVSGVIHVQNNIRVQQQNLHSGSAGLGTAGMAGLGSTTGAAGVAMAGQGAGGTASGRTGAGSPSTSSMGMRSGGTDAGSQGSAGGSTGSGTSDRTK